MSSTSLGCFMDKGGEYGFLLRQQAPWKWLRKMWLIEYSNNCLIKYTRQVRLIQEANKSLKVIPWLHDISMNYPSSAITSPGPVLRVMSLGIFVESEDRIWKWVRTLACNLGGSTYCHTSFGDITVVAPVPFFVHHARTCPDLQLVVGRTW